MDQIFGIEKLIREKVREELIKILADDAILKKLMGDHLIKRKKLSVYELIPREGIGHTRLMRLSGMAANHLAQITAELINSDKIEAEVFKTATKPKIIYRRIN